MNVSVPDGAAKTTKATRSPSHGSPYGSRTCRSPDPAHLDADLKLLVDARDQRLRRRHGPQPSHALLLNMAPGITTPQGRTPELGVRSGSELYARARKSDPITGQARLAAIRRERPARRTSRPRERHPRRVGTTVHHTPDPIFFKKRKKKKKKEEWNGPNLCRDRPPCRGPSRPSKRMSGRRSPLPGLEVLPAVASPPSPPPEPGDRSRTPPPH